MSRSHLQLSAVSSRPRQALVQQLVNVLNEHGWVLDSQQFSNIALAVKFEVSARNLAKLGAALVSLPMAFSEPSLALLSQLENTAAGDLPDEIAGSIHLTFVHSEPDLRQEIPAVPG